MFLNDNKQLVIYAFSSLIYFDGAYILQNGKNKLDKKSIFKISLFLNYTEESLAAYENNLNLEYLKKDEILT